MRPRTVFRKSPRTVATFRVVSEENCESAFCEREFEVPGARCGRYWNEQRHAGAESRDPNLGFSG